MSKLEWNRPQDQIFEAGLDRGVIYVEDGPVVAWSGLSSVDDEGESTIREFFIDGIKYLAMVSPRDWKGKLVAYTYPAEFAELIGVAEMGDGLYVDSQVPGRFNLSYRTMISAPAVDTIPHYKIHLIYKVMASLAGFTSETLTSDATDPTGFEFELSAVPIQIPGRRPSAHIILDTRKMTDSTRTQLEDLIYGSDTQEPTLPTIPQLVDLLNYGDEVIVVDNGDGTWTATGSNANIQILDDEGHFAIHNVAAEYLSEDIYRFLGVDGSPAQLALIADTDGVPYVKLAESNSNMGIDFDGVPYFMPGASTGVIREDTDGEFYFTTH